MQDWLNQNLGRINLNPKPPHGIAGQCVNAASSWSMLMGGPELFPGATAWEIWLNFSHPFFEKVTSGFQPRDILFYRPNDPAVGTGSAGHVDIYVGGAQTADADWNGILLLQLVNSNLASKAAGAFRQVTAPSAQGEPMVDKDRMDKEYYMTLGHGASADDFAYWVGKPWPDLIDSLAERQERIDRANKIAADEAELAALKAAGSGVTKQSVVDYINQHLS